MTSADFSQFVVTARLPFFLKPRLRDLPSYGRTLSGLYPLGLLSAVRIVIGLLLPLQHYPCLPALYQVLVHRANRLPPASFRFHLTMDTLAFGCNLPTIRAVWGLAPVRVRSCWADKIVCHLAKRWQTGFFKRYFQCITSKSNHSVNALLPNSRYHPILSFLSFVDTVFLCI